MRISKINIPDWKHFQNFELNLCYPADYKDPSKRGKPLDRVCFIGRNGTGKTNLLDLLKVVVDRTVIGQTSWGAEYDNQEGNIEISVFFKENEEESIYLRPYRNTDKPIDFAKKSTPYFEELHYHRTILVRGDISFGNYLLADDDAKAEPNGFIDPFNQSEKTAIFSTLNLKKLIEAFKARFIRRAVLFAKFAKENQHKSYFELNQMVDEICPAYLEEIKVLWDNIFKFAKLYLDIDNTKVPDIQSNDFSFAIQHQQLTDIDKYTKEKTPKQIELDDLSTGMREFMFKIGSLKLYYQEHLEYWRERKKAGYLNAQDTVPFTSLFMDEPENGLFVDMLYNYFDNYLNFITPENTQLFVATHSPIIASQFEPEERVILYFDEAGNVRAKRGSAPIGDDVNDMMMNDFGTDVYGRHKIEQAEWKTYRDILMRLEMNLDDEETQTQLIKKGLELAQKRGFHGENELKSYNRKLKKPKTPK